MRAAVFVLLTLSAVVHGQTWLRTVASDDGTTVICVTWAKRTIVYQVDAAGSAQTPGDTEFAAIDAAFATWQALSDSCSDMKFIAGPRVSNPKVGRKTEDSNVLTFREVNCVDVVPAADPCLADGSCANTYRCWDHSDTTIALTTSTYSTRTGVLADADIEFNASRHQDGSSFLFTTVSSPPCAEAAVGVTCVANDLQNTATHEIGHLVGFAHVTDPSSTMYPSAPIGETTKRVIDVGTSDGFCGTYPRGAAPVPCDELARQNTRITASTQGCGCHASAGSEGWGALVLLAFSGLQRRARKACAPWVTASS
jgi:hypothetical protein